MNWKEYHEKRRVEFLRDRGVRPIGCFNDEDKITLAEAGATCYHPNEKDGWDTREWLEGIYCVLNHGCCTRCDAQELCEKLSRS